MSKKIVLMILLLPVVTLTLANSAELKDTKATQQMVTKNEVTKPIVIRKSQRTFKVELPSNATT